MMEVIHWQDWQSWTSCDSELETNLEQFSVLLRLLSPSWLWTCLRRVCISSSRYVCFSFFHLTNHFTHSTTLSSTTIVAPHCYEDDVEGWPRGSRRVCMSSFPHCTNVYSQYGPVTSTIMVSTTSTTTVVPDWHEDNDKGCRSRRRICFSSSSLQVCIFSFFLLFYY